MEGKILWLAAFENKYKNLKTTKVKIEKYRNLSQKI